MTKGYDYRTVDSTTLFKTRDVLRMPASEKSSLNSRNRTFVPFAGFDGQKLAGTGALVWEGELLEERRH